MQSIGKMSLKNQGGFVCKLQFVFWDANGNKQRTGGSGDIDLGQSDTEDPGAYGVPDGAPVSIYVDVVWGDDNEGSQMFTYSKGSSCTANYAISGTTLDNSLGLTGMSGC